MTAGRLTDMVAFQIHGWELVISHVSDALVRVLETAGRRLVRLSEGRYTAELPLDPPPDGFISEVSAAGGRLVSVNPIRQTLEDFFVQQVTSPLVKAQSRGLDGPVSGGRA